MALPWVGCGHDLLLGNEMPARQSTTLGDTVAFRSDRPIERLTLIDARAQVFDSHEIVGDGPQLYAQWTSQRRGQVTIPLGVTPGKAWLLLHEYGVRTPRAVPLDVQRVLYLLDRQGWLHSVSWPAGEVRGAARRIGQGDAAATLSLSSDGRLLATLSDGRARAFRTGQKLVEYPLPQMRAIRAMAAHDGALLLATGDELHHLRLAVQDGATERLSVHKRLLPGDITAIATVAGDTPPSPGGNGSGWRQEVIVGGPCPVAAGAVSQLCFAHILRRASRLEAIAELVIPERTEIRQLLAGGRHWLDGTLAVAVVLTTNGLYGLAFHKGAPPTWTQLDIDTKTIVGNVAHLSIWGPTKGMEVVFLVATRDQGVRVFGFRGGDLVFLPAYEQQIQAPKGELLAIGRRTELFVFSGRRVRMVDFDSSVATPRGLDLPAHPLRAVTLGSPDVE